MTTKKSTAKKVSKVKRPAATRKTAGAKRGERVADATAPAAEVQETAEAATVSVLPVARKRGRRRPPAEAGSRAGEGKASVATAPPGAPGSRRFVEPLSPAAEVEEANGTIVIRFPPVAPSPFAAPEVAPKVSPEPSGPVPVVSKVVPEAVVARPEPRGRNRVAPAAPCPPTPIEVAAAPRPVPPVLVPVVEGKTEQVAVEPGEDQTGLSRSQRRRQRRRRHQEHVQDGSPGAAAAGAPRAAPAPASENGGPLGPGQAAVVLGEEIETSDEELAPWLDDAAELRADFSEPELSPPPVEVDELIEPGGAGAEETAVAEDAPVDLTAAPAGEAPAAGERGRRRRRRGRRSNRREGPIEGGPPARDEGVEVAPLEREAVKPVVEAKRAAGPLREMIINTIQREECRIAILADGRLEEIYLERAAAENHVGNIYKAIVTNVEPSIQAAFLDFGQGKNGFLHISDLHPEYFPDGGGQSENVGRKMPRRNRPPIQRCLRRGQVVLVQVTKEGIGTKGPTLSTYLSIPGRFLVMMPGMRRLGVSRRIEDEDCRDRLRDALGDLELPEGMGFIARTAALDRTKRELQNDLSYLTRLWRAVEKRIQNDPPPAELYRESDLVIRTIRDVFTPDIQRIVVDDPEVLARGREFLSIFSPNSEEIMTLYPDPEPVFHKYKIEAELERLHSRHVPLKSGGSLVIDQTEALVAIDVNSGRFRSEDDAEATAYRINVEAADEIPRQLRLRDLGGVIVCDFIDMRLESHRRDIERRLIENLKKHKERAKVLRTSAFGMIEMTRQRQRASLTRSVYRDCRHCRGTGLVKTVESVVLDVIRLIQLAATREHIRTIEITVSPEVAYLLQNRKRSLIHELETKHRRIISIRPEPAFSLDQVEISCTDARGRVVPHT